MLVATNIIIAALLAAALVAGLLELRQRRRNRAALKEWMAFLGEE